MGHASEAGGRGFPTEFCSTAEVQAGARAYTVRPMLCGGRSCKPVPEVKVSEFCMLCTVASVGPGSMVTWRFIATRLPTVLRSCCPTGPSCVKPKRKTAGSRAGRTHPGNPVHASSFCVSVECRRTVRGTVEMVGCFGVVMELTRT